MEDWEFRLFGDYTRWSVMETQCVVKTSEPDRKCNFDNADTALEDPESYGKEGEVKGVVQNLPRFWNDSFGVRLSASYWFLDELETLEVGA